MVICVIAAPQTPNISKRLALDALRREHVVHLIDVRHILGMSLAGREVLHQDDSVLRIKNWAELFDALKRLAPSVVLDISSSNFLLKVLAWKSRTRGFLLVKIRDGVLPQMPLGRRVLVRLKTASMGRPSSGNGTANVSGVSRFQGPFWSLAKVGLDFLKELASIYFGPRVDIELIAGLEAGKRATRRARVLASVASLDLEYVSSLNSDSKNGIVFLDEAISDAKDYEIIGLSRPVEPQDYYPWLQQALADLSVALNSPVVIAIHPDNADRAAFYREMFPNFECVAHRSMEILAKSRFAVFHKSAIALCAIEAGAIPISLGLPMHADLMTLSSIDVFSDSVQSHMFQVGVASVSDSLLRFVKNYDSKTVSTSVRLRYLGDPRKRREDLLLSACSRLKDGWSKKEVILRFEKHGIGLET